MKKTALLTALAILATAMLGCPSRKRSVKIETPEKKVEIEVKTTDKH